MRIASYRRVLALTVLTTACGEDKDPLDTAGNSGASMSGGPTNPSGAATSEGDGTTGDMTGGTTGDDPTGGSADNPKLMCELYIECIANTTPNELPEAQAGFGEGSTCWSGTPADAELCGTACATGLEQYHEMFPDEPTCDPCQITECAAVEGTYLLAISTPLDRDLPFQFLVDGTVPLQSGTLELTARPLRLDMGSVSTPRQPVGETFMWNNIEVVGGQFELATGEINLPGEANPIFGVPVVVDVVLSGTIMGEGLFCGTASGSVVLPVEQSLDGSTFAAVKVAGLDQLPLNVTVDCQGKKVSD